MSTHLAHKLPWEALSDATQLKCIRNNGNHEPMLSEKQLRSVFHFGRCLSNAIKEFAATDSSSDEEKEAYDPSTWGFDYAESREAWHLGYYDSVIWGYVELNLIIMDPKVFAPMLMGWGERHRGTDAMDSMRGDHSGNHPDWLANHIQQAFDGYRMKPITADVLQILREHCAKMFKCMYSMSDPQGELEPNALAERIARRFGIYYDIYMWREANPDATL